MERLYCLLIGYAFGCLLTAEIVARCCAHCSCAEIGTGNPGMANIMAQLGFWPGAAVLAGDAGKALIACALCRWIFGASLGPENAALYAGIGAALGHNFPVWHRFRGGKGVAVTCACLLVAAPLWGILADVAGMLVVFSTGWLPLGAVVIPVVFTAEAFALYGTEAGVLALLLALLMFSRHWHGLRRIIKGTEEHHAQFFARGKKKDTPPSPEK
jgi:glycerol-3-phosphate acyltransferase PlsY